MRDVVQNPYADTLDAIGQAMVQALVVQELRRLHEGVLARYGLRPSELTAWQSVQRAP